MTTTTHQIVLGGNGVIGRETVRALVAADIGTVSIGRRPATTAGARSEIVDLLNADAVSRSFQGAEVAYLTVGLPYSARVWAEQWPVIVRNSVAAAMAHGTHLVYLDNVYAYGLVDDVMTEHTSIAPKSRKGQVRADALSELDKAAAQGLSVTIGRSADFYGPGAATSAFNTLCLDEIAAGNSGTWLLDADQPHSLTYTPDIGDALAILGNNPKARGRTWHLPTAPALTGRQYIETAAGPHAHTRVISRAKLRIGAIFNSAARETLEMDYQYTRPYLFDSNQFHATFGMRPTPAAEGIALAIRARRATS